MFSHHFNDILTYSVKMLKTFGGPGGTKFCLPWNLFLRTKYQYVGIFCNKPKINQNIIQIFSFYFTSMEYIYNTKDIYILLGDGRFTYETVWGGVLDGEVERTCGWDWELIEYIFCSKFYHLWKMSLIGIRIWPITK